MNVSVLQYMTWGSYAGGALLLAASLLRHGHYRRWPFLFALAWYEVALCAALFWINPHTHLPLYRTVYWYGAVVRGFLRLGVIADLIQSIPRIKAAPRHLLAGFTGVALAIAVGSMLVAGRGHLMGWRVSALSAHLDSNVAWTWGCVALTMFFGMDLLGLRWNDQGLRIAAGYVAGTLSAFVFARCIDSWPDYRSALDICESWTLSAVWLFWSWALWEPAAPLFNLNPSQTAIFVKQLRAALSLFPPSSTKG